MKVISNSDLEIHRLPGLLHQTLSNKHNGGQEFEVWKQIIKGHSSTPVHKHNCDEQVTLIEGEAVVEIEGKTTSVSVRDTTYIEAGTWHRFINTGESRMTILWVYDTEEVTRTFQQSGKTVQHLSGEDVVTA